MPDAVKTDLKKELASYRASRGGFSVVTVPPLQYLMIDGHGDPNGAEFAAALETLYPVAYTLKFASKRAGRDYAVMPLEALWSSDDMASFTSARDKSRWDWTVLNLVPDWIGGPEFRDARDAVERKGGATMLERLRLERLDEGLCVQTLHVGSFDDEGPVLDELHHQFIPDNGLRMTGRHHEIYLSDLRRTAPEKLRTILRQPVAR